VIQGDRSDDPPTGASCLYSRLPVRIRPEWTDVLLNGDHRFNLRLIGRQIIFTRSDGRFISRGDRGGDNDAQHPAVERTAGSGWSDGPH